MVLNGDRVSFCQVKGALQLVPRGDGGTRVSVLNASEAIKTIACMLLCVLTIKKLKRALSLSAVSSSGWDPIAEKLEPALPMLWQWWLLRCDLSCT